MSNNPYSGKPTFRDFLKATTYTLIGLGAIFAIDYYQSTQENPRKQESIEKKIDSPKEFKTLESGN
jgi:hypothetical protein